MKGGATLLGLVLVLALQAGCSGACEDGQIDCACRSDRSCVDGATCLVTQCVADASLEDGDTCTHDVQCGADLLCAPALFKCRAPCTELLEGTATCGADRYCAPVTDSDGPACDATTPCAAGTCVQNVNGDLHCRILEGVCNESECDPTAAAGEHGACDTGNVCISLDSQLGAAVCLPDCEISWGSGDYTDNCGSVPVDPIYCQPVGEAGAEHLVCLDTAHDAGAAGDACSPIAEPCQIGLVCDAGTCRNHCNVQDTTAGDAYCAAQDAAAPLCCSIAGGITGACKASCN